jgi:curved DNA-binding protein CbpA
MTRGFPVSPYAVLRIAPDATPEQIEEAYCRMRRLIGSGVSERQLQSAYAILKDPIRRALADMQLQKPSQVRAEVASAGGSWIRRLLRK